MSASGENPLFAICPATGEEHSVSFYASGDEWYQYVDHISCSDCGYSWYPDGTVESVPVHQIMNHKTQNHSHHQTK